MDRSAQRPPRSGFTLMEVMLVIAVIGILMAMVGAAAYGARQRAYRTQATAEVQQIATAFKSYYLANHKWPKHWESGCDWENGKLNRSNLGPLLGDEGVVYLDLSDFRLEGTGGSAAFVDPWGEAYEVQTDRLEHPEISDVFEGAVSFPNFMRHYYEEGVYDPDADWPWEEGWSADE